MTKKTLKPLRCKRTSVRESRSEHTQRIHQKRAEQRALGTGFFPVANPRIDGAIQAQALLLTASGMSAIEAHNEARRIVARKLPMPRQVRSIEKLLRPTKNNDPVYRKQIAAPAPKKPGRRKKSAA